MERNVDQGIGAVLEGASAFGVSQEKLGCRPKTLCHYWLAPEKAYLCRRRGRRRSGGEVKVQEPAPHFW